jgi:hypothetical protein
MTIALEACEIVPGMPLDGVGSWDAVTEVFILDVEIGADRLAYRSTAFDRHVSGTFGGRAVDGSE